MSPVDKVIERIEAVRDAWRENCDEWSTREVMDAFNYVCFIVESYRNELENINKV